MILENLEIQKVTTMKEKEKPSSLPENFIQKMEERMKQKHQPMRIRAEDVDITKRDPELMEQIRKAREEKDKAK